MTIFMRKYKNLLWFKPVICDTFQSSSGSETTQKCPLSILSRKTRGYPAALMQHDESPHQYEWAMEQLNIQIQADLDAGYTFHHWATFHICYDRRARRQQKTKKGGIAFHWPEQRIQYICLKKKTSGCLNQVLAGIRPANLDSWNRLTSHRN